MKPESLFRGSAVALCLLLTLPALAQSPRESYEKREFTIPMRDGATLYTAVYLPKNKPGKHPILLERTPYGAGPYGPMAYRFRFGGSKKLMERGYIFAYQDVRGMGKSQGRFVNVRPQLLNTARPHDIDESTDTYDTVEFLTKKLPESNGRVGMWGISYPGFYAAIGAINTHPALKAVSPQAPVADWFIGDDFHHNGALMLMDAMRFGRFGETGRPQAFGGFSPDRNADAYKLFLDLGPLPQITKNYFATTDGMWKHLMEHDTYDDFWQARALPDKLKNVSCAVLTVGGWYDAEDCWGALNVYAATEKQNPKITNALVMGPWYHGMWAAPDGSKLGDISFGQNTSAYYQENIELPFFEAFLRGEGSPKVPEAQVFETGTNRWRQFSAWPPKESKETSLYFAPGKTLSPAKPTAASQDSYESDPASPVPYEGGTIRTRTLTYPVADQRFASERPDVLSYRLPVQEKPLTIAGPITADLTISTTGTDCDLVVKVIDVFPADAPGGMGGYQRLVRAEVMRSKFRQSYANPTALVPDAPTTVRFTLPDVLHTFEKGHQLLVQVQSSWFPLVDRNPQSFVNINQAKPEDFKKATIRLHTGGETASRLQFRTLEPRGN